MTLAGVFGCTGFSVSAGERAFFREARPWGFILFGRNVRDPAQVAGLVQALREAADRPDAPVFIDQEGGRVQRLGPPHWRRYPPARTFEGLGLDDCERRELVRLSARLMAHDLAALGINVDCAPVLDVPVSGAHDVIGDRAYGDNAGVVARLGRAAAEGLIAGGVLPVIKHIPGHGRARSDSHEVLPVVDADLAELEAQDLPPFRALSDMPIAMTAHVVFTAVDPQAPCTTSAPAIERLVRRGCGFDGLLISDDLSMKALSGGLGERARAALVAGCDLVLHCNGDLAEMAAVANETGPLAGRAAQRAQAALARIPAMVEPFDAEAAAARLTAAQQRRPAA